MPFGLRDWLGKKRRKVIKDAVTPPVNVETGRMEAYQRDLMRTMEIDRQAYDAVAQRAGAQRGMLMEEVEARIARLQQQTTGVTANELDRRVEHILLTTPHITRREARERVANEVRHQMRQQEVNERAWGAYLGHQGFDEETTEETKVHKELTDYLEVPFATVGDRLDNPEHALSHLVQARIQELKEKHGTITRAEQRITRNPHNRSWGIQIKLTILEEKMPELPNYLKELMLKPPADIAQRSLDKSHLFDEVLQQLRNRDSELVNNNNRDTLGASNFLMHPFIHRGYYDSKKGGTLYVKDSETGKNIRKDNSILLSTGVFVKSDSTCVVSLNNRGSDRALIARALEGDKKAVEWAKGKFFKVANAGIYVPLDLTIIKCAVDGTRLSRAIHSIFDTYCQRIGFVLTETGDNFSQEIYDGFKHHLAENLVQFLRESGDIKHVHFPTNAPLAKTRFYLPVPDDADFLQGWLLTQEGYRDFSKNVRDATARTGVESRPSMAINYGGGIRIADPTGPVGEMERNSRRFSVIGLTYNFPVEMSIRVQAQDAVQRNRKNKNNDGFMLNYMAKVPDFKRSFLMTEAETHTFGAKEEKLKARLREYNKEKAKLMDKYHRGDFGEKEGRLLMGKIKMLKLPKTNPSERPVFLGVEVEYTPRKGNDTDRMEIIRDMANTPFGDHMIVKSDRSIETDERGNPSYGLEIVTIPATLGWHKKMFDDHFFNEKNAFHKRVIAPPQCGIHVHVDKAAFTRLTLGKFITFINAPQTQDFVNDLAGRGENQYCARFKLKGKNKKGIDQSVAIANRINMNGKTDHLPRSAINVQTIDKTVEVRIFKSSNNRNNVLRKIEFCDALVHFCRVAGAQQITVYDFVEFLLQKENKKDYPCMIKWLGSRKYIGHTRDKIKGQNKLAHVYGTNLVTKS